MGILRARYVGVILKNEKNIVIYGWRRVPTLWAWFCGRGPAGGACKKERNIAVICFCRILLTYEGVVLSASPIGVVHGRGPYGSETKKKFIGRVIVGV